MKKNVINYGENFFILKYEGFLGKINLFLHIELHILKVWIYMKDFLIVIVKKIIWEIIHFLTLFLKLLM